VKTKFFFFKGKVLDEQAQIALFDLINERINHEIELYMRINGLISFEERREIMRRIVGEYNNQ